jgi:hypothetical protein
VNKKQKFNKLNPHLALHACTFLLFVLPQHINFKLTNAPFSWQRGFAVFSFAHSQKNEVIRFVENQPEFHEKRSFEEEFRTLLQKCELEIDEPIFEFFNPKG